jgi:hypothetical protein
MQARRCARVVRYALARGSALTQYRKNSSDLHVVGALSGWPALTRAPQVVLCPSVNPKVTPGDVQNDVLHRLYSAPRPGSQVGAMAAAGAVTSRAAKLGVYEKGDVQLSAIGQRARDNQACVVRCCSRAIRQRCCATTMNSSRGRTGAHETQTTLAPSALCPMCRGALRRWRPAITFFFHRNNRSGRPGS